MYLTKTNRNILNILWCIENANINIQLKFHIRFYVSKVIFLELHQEQNSILRENSRFSLILILFFSALLNTIWSIKF